ncbi:sensor domain-containing protein [Kitasatospora sp. NPDC059795]|uniref:sensor domain-containing protein n=1 Tax=Kitasatospora sp. NPDC059795 TaxID=3346949 RepID=UPI003668277E
MSTAAYRATTGNHPTRPGFWRAPISRAAFRELGFALSGLPVAILGFSVVVSLFATGLGLAITMLGLPVLALLTIAGRGFGAAERFRIRTLLDLDLPEPREVTAGREGVWGAITARLADPVGWKGAFYQFAMFPWAILSFTLSTVFFTVGWSLLLFPAYQWVFGRYTDWDGYRVANWTDSHGVHHVYDITSPFQIAGVSLIGLLFVLLTPQLVRALNGANRLAARALLAGR